MSKEILMNTNKFTISWGDFSRYRSSMFGLSIIGIMVFHYFEHIRSAHLLLDQSSSGTTTSVRPGLTSSSFCPGWASSIP